MMTSQRNFGLCFHAYSVVVTTTAMLVTLTGANHNASTPGVVSEYCETDEFIASCPSDDEMIVMQSAHFGRMRLGRCLTVNNGNLGCQLDVLDQLDPLCSGRRRCSVVVATIDHRTLACTREVRGYLEASYLCVKVVTRRKADCQRPGALEIEAASSGGYLASVVTEETGCGSPESPWLLSAPPGQTIQLRLLDFNATSRDSRTHEDPQQKLICQVYAVVKEKKTRRPSDTICASHHHRESFVYSSLSNRMEIRIVTNSPGRRRHKADYFAIKYQLVGCADLTTVGDEGAPHWMQRNGDLAVFGCNGSSSTWKLKCDGNQWVGERGFCHDVLSIDTIQADEINLWNAFTSSQWAAIIVIMVIAVVIGILIFIGGLIYLKRSRRSGVHRGGLPGPRCNPNQPDYHLTFASDLHGAHSPTKSTVVAATLPSPCSGAEQSSSGENDYFRTWQLQRHMSYPATTAAVAVRTAGIGRPTPASLRLVPAGGGQVSSRRPAPEHIYESPRLERRELVLPTSTVGECTCYEQRRGSTDLLATTDCQSPIQYYELDQSGRPVHL